MQYVITINLDNEAFEDGHTEIRRILTELAEEVCPEYGPITMAIKDINGNTVGRAEIKEGE